MGFLCRICNRVERKKRNDRQEKREGEKMGRRGGEREGERDPTDGRFGEASAMQFM